MVDKYLTLYILIASLSLGGCAHIPLPGRWKSQTEIDESERKQASQAREIEELRNKLQELNIQLNQLTQSRNLCYQNVKELEEEKRSSQQSFAERLRLLEEEKIKALGDLAAARKREEALGSDLEQTRSRLRQSIEAREKEIQELSRIKTELAGELKEYLATGEVLVNEEKRGVVITLMGVAPLRSEGVVVRAEDRLLLQKVSRILKKYPDREVLIEGHTDDEPITSSQFPSNWELSTARATTILRYLEEKEGISPKRLSAVGYGEYRPLATNTTPEGRQKNRRVEIVILPQRGL